MAYQVTLTHQAAKQLGKLTQSTAHDIGAKIAWLAQNIESIRHERLKGHEEYSLHSGGYRILYSLDHTRQLVIIEDVDEHDAAYRRLRRR